MKINYRKIYKEKLISYFTENNIDFSENTIKNVLNKVAINSRNKYGSVSFEDELIESDISGGIFFYKEGLLTQKTYNNKNKQ